MSWFFKNNAATATAAYAANLIFIVPKAILKKSTVRNLQYSV